MRIGEWRTTCRSEEGTTTPFDMVMLNDLDRFRLVMGVIDRVPSLGSRPAVLRQQMSDARLAARADTREYGEGTTPKSPTGPGQQGRVNQPQPRGGKPNEG